MIFINIPMQITRIKDEAKMWTIEEQYVTRFGKKITEFTLFIIVNTIIKKF
jgi:hypothetical protein